MIEEVDFLKGLDEKEKELKAKKESGEITCNTDNPEECISCGS